MRTFHESRCLGVSDTLIHKIFKSMFEKNNLFQTTYEIQFIFLAATSF